MKKQASCEAEVNRLFWGKLYCAVLRGWSTLLHARSRHTILCFAATIPEDTQDHFYRHLLNDIFHSSNGCNMRALSAQDFSTRMGRHKRARPSGISSSILRSFCICILFQLPTACGNNTKCKAVAVPKDMAAVTCTYPLNLNETKRSFCLIQYEGDKKRTDVVTACSWDGAELLCVFEEGFHFRQHTVSDTFTVELPKEKGVGEFSCDTIPPDTSVTVEKCTLSSTDSGVDENVSTNTTVNPIPRATRPAQDSDKCGCVTSKGLLAAIVVLSTTIVVLSILLVALYVHYKRRFRSFHGRSMDKECAHNLTEESPCEHCAGTSNSLPKQENQSNGHINSSMV